MSDPFRYGYGTETLRIDVLDHGAYADTIAASLDGGYRHLDTSQHADTEHVVGEALRRSGVPRDEVIVATKVHPRDLSPGDVPRSVEGSRERLGVDVIDVVYVHAPKAAYDPAGTLAAFDQLVTDGLARHVGVCHFTAPQLIEALDRLETPLYAHQVERHPLLQQRELLALAHEHDHWLVAASPLIRGFVAEVREIAAIADRRALTPTQVTLAWHHHDGKVATLPHTRDPGHLQQNLEASRTALDDADIRGIDDIEREWRLHPWFGT